MFGAGYGPSGPPNGRQSLCHTPGYGGAQTPGYGGSARTPGYGGAQGPGYGGAQGPGYGGAQTPGYGGAPASGYGGAPASGYGGAQTPGYGGPPAPCYGGAQTPGYGGAPPAPCYGGAQSQGYGGAQTPGYAGAQTPGYGGAQTPGYGGAQAAGFSQWPSQQTGPPAMTPQRATAAQRGPQARKHRWPAAAGGYCTPPCPSGPSGASGGCCTPPYPSNPLPTPPLGFSQQAANYCGGPSPPPSMQPSTMAPVSWQGSVPGSEARRPSIGGLMPSLPGGHQVGPVQPPPLSARRPTAEIGVPAAAVPLSARRPSAEVGPPPAADAVAAPQPVPSARRPAADFVAAPAAAPASTGRPASELGAVGVAEAAAVVQQRAVPMMVRRPTVAVPVATHQGPAVEFVAAPPQAFVPASAHGAPAVVEVAAVPPQPFVPASAHGAPALVEVAVPASADHILMPERHSVAVAPGSQPVRFVSAPARPASVGAPVPQKLTFRAASTAVRALVVPFSRGAFPAAAAAPHTARRASRAARRHTTRTLSPTRVHFAEAVVEFGGEQAAPVAVAAPVAAAAPAALAADEQVEIGRLRAEIARLQERHQGLQAAPVQPCSYAGDEIALLKKQLEDLLQQNSALQGVEAQNKKLRAVGLGQIKDGKCVMDLTALRQEHAEAFVARRTTVFRKSLDPGAFDLDDDEAPTQLIDLTAFRD